MRSSRILITGIGVVGADLCVRPEVGPHTGGPLHAAKTYLDPNSELALASTALALRDAQVKITEASAPSVGMSFGTRLGNITTVEAYLKMLREQGVKLASPLLFIHAYPNTSVSLAAIEFRVMGTSFNFNSGRFCGLQALVQAYDELRAGKMSVMLAGAADTYTETMRPCAAGTALNAGCMLVLEREADALARGTRGVAELAGCGLARTPEEALSRALADGSIGSPEIDWLLVDSPRGEIGREGAGVHTTDLLKVLGDCGAATSLLGVSLAVLVMSEGKIPAGIGLAEPPIVAAVVSADDPGAAAVVLRKLAG